MGSIGDPNAKQSKAKVKDEEFGPQMDADRTQMESLVRMGSEPKEFGPQMDADRTQMESTIWRKTKGKWWRLDLVNASCLIDVRFSYRRLSVLICGPMLLSFLSGPFFLIDRRSCWSSGDVEAREDQNEDRKGYKAWRAGVSSPFGCDWCGRAFRRLLEDL